MTRYYVTFSGTRYFDTTRRIVEDAPKFGADRVLVADDAWLKRSHPDYWDRMAWFRQHRHTGEDRPRGVDWFCWKSYVIREMFKRIAPGDVMLYTDSDTYPIGDLTPLYEQCVADGGALLFGARGCVQRQWSKRDIFLLMDADTGEYHNEYQAVARFLLFRKPTGDGTPGSGGPEFDVERFLLDWLAYTSSVLVNTFRPSILAPELDGFCQSRCEQSVLSVLGVRYGLAPFYREACGFGGWEDPVNPRHEREWPGAKQLFVQHGGHTYRPGFSGDESEGSSFRNVD